MSTLNNNKNKTREVLVVFEMSEVASELPLYFSIHVTRRYLCFVAFPLTLATFVGGLVYFLLNLSSTTIHVCEYNSNIRIHDDNYTNYRQQGAYDCSTAVTEKHACDAYYIVSGYHGDTQDVASAKFFDANAVAEPMLVCIKNFDLWASFNNAVVSSLTVWVLLYLVGPFAVKLGICGSSAPQSQARVACRLLGRAGGETGEVYGGRGENWMAGEVVRQEGQSALGLSRVAKEVGGEGEVYGGSGENWIAGEVVRQED